MEIDKIVIVAVQYDIMRVLYARIQNHLGGVPIYGPFMLSLALSLCLSHSLFRRRRVRTSYNIYYYSFPR